MIALLLACSTAPEAPVASATPTPPTLDVAAVLAKADAHDGAVDHTVGECAGCGLMMDGDPAHARSHGDYTLHFCAETCAMRFEQDPMAVLGPLSTSKALE